MPLAPCVRFVKPMRMRLAGIVALLSVYVLSLTMTVRANSNALLIELPNGVLPTAVSANGTIVGALETGGGFYWMPTTGDIFVGGKAAVGDPGAKIPPRSREGRWKPGRQPARGSSRRPQSQNAPPGPFAHAATCART